MAKNMLLNNIFCCFCIVNFNIKLPILTKNINVIDWKVATICKKTDELLWIKSDIIVH